MPSSSLATCAFCAVASASAPFSPADHKTPSKHTASNNNNNNDVNGNDGASVLDPSSSPAHVILSTKHVVAFLDIMPLTRGHLLVIPRKHYGNLGDVRVQDAKELGKWLPILSRVVVRTVLGNEIDERGDDPHHWNVVQNNGSRASQTVPHAHFHIIPRPPLDGRTPTSGGWIMFGRGQRDELDDDEAEELVSLLRSELAREVKRVKEEEGVDVEDDDNDNDDGEGSVGRKSPSKL